MRAPALDRLACARHVIEYALDAQPPVDALAAACLQPVQRRPGRTGLLA